MLIVPAAAILSVVDEAIAKGVKALVVISAGFKEVGARGRGTWKPKLARQGPRGRHSADRPELPGRDQHRSRPSA